MRLMVWTIIKQSTFEKRMTTVTSSKHPQSAPQSQPPDPMQQLLRSDHPQSMRDMVVWIADPFHYKIAAELLHSVKTGQPTVEHVTGKPAFEYFSSDAVEFDRFHRAMTTMSSMAIFPAIDAYG